MAYMICSVTDLSTKAAVHSMLGYALYGPVFPLKEPFEGNF